MPDRTLPPGQEALTALPLPDGSAVPHEIMILPAPLEAMHTVDGRGPFRLTDVQGMIARSMDPRRNGGRLVIDVNHSTDKLGAIGGEAPARGWITGLSARDGAVFAKVEWTEAGRAMVAAREYRSISPVIVAPEGEVRQVLRASLTNDPALLGLATLNTPNRETPMNDLLVRLAKKLGKPDTATADELLTAIPDPQAAVTLTALQGQVTLLCAALGVSDIAAALPMAEALKAKGASVETLSAQVAALEKASKMQAAEAWMAGEIAAMRGVPADKRQGLIELFTSKPDEARAIVALYPLLGGTGTSATPPAQGGAVTLTAEQKAVAAALGIPEAKFLETLKAEKESR